MSLCRTRCGGLGTLRLHRLYELVSSVSPSPSCHQLVDREPSFCIFREHEGVVESGKTGRWSRTSIMRGGHGESSSPPARAREIISDRMHEDLIYFSIPRSCTDRTSSSLTFVLGHTTYERLLTLALGGWCLSVDVCVCVCVRRRARPWRTTRRTA